MSDRGNINLLLSLADPINNAVIADAVAVHTGQLSVQGTNPRLRIVT